MNRTTAPQKLVSFSESKSDFEKIKEYMKEGWSIISLMRNGPYYIGVMEKCLENVHYSNEGVTIFLPPRKKINITY